MTDVLGLADVCISTASTAVLDGVYMDVPMAIYENDQPVFQNLPNITGVDDVEYFVSNPSGADLTEIQFHYGDVEKNFEKCCDTIEMVMQ